MTHPHGLTNADVAHLKEGMEVTLEIEYNGGQRFTGTAPIYDVKDGWLCWLGWMVRTSAGQPWTGLVRVVSPKPPAPPMEEPTWIGAIVMTATGPAIRIAAPSSTAPCVEVNPEVTSEWEDLMYPRPLTADERRQYGIPETIPDGWVAVDVRDLPRRTIEAFIEDGIDGPAPASVYIRMALDRVGRAELARRETQR